MAFELDRIYLGDCRELMREIPDQSVDLVLTDPPYGVTKNRWDVPVPFEDLWAALGRVVKDRAPTVMFGIPPFSSQAIVSNPKWFRYSWIWDKHAPVGFLNANRAPLRRYEVISVFSKKAPTYYPQKTEGSPYRNRRNTTGRNYGAYAPSETVNKGTRYPTDIIDQFPNTREIGGHPTQKPVPLLEYLIMTYTKPGEVVLDPFIGSGSTAVACINTGRRFIGFELLPEYYEIAVARIRDAQEQARLFPFPEEGSA